MMEFTKYHGLGNDFIVVEDFEGRLLDEASTIAKQVCDRHFGIGADGLVLITASSKFYTMRIFNADGSEAEMCGNAIRCVAKHLIDRGFETGSIVRIGTVSGTKQIKVYDNLFSVDMGEPVFPDQASITVEVEGVKWTIFPASMGNPHGVVFVDDLDGLDFLRWGPLLEKHPIWPEQANIEFVTLIDEGAIRIKVWERGVGPTLACGTGACAAAVTAAKLGKVGRTIQVTLPGGQLKIEWKDNNHVWMTGPATKVFEGTI